MRKIWRCLWFLWDGYRDGWCHNQRQPMIKFSQCQKFGMNVTLVTVAAATYVNKPTDRWWWFFGVFPYWGPGPSTVGKKSSSCEDKCAVLGHDSPSQDLLFKWSQFVCVVRGHGRDKVQVHEPPRLNKEVCGCRIRPKLTLKPKHDCTQWLLKVKHWSQVVAGVSKIEKTNIHRDKESFSVCGCALQQCRDTLNCSKHTEAKRLVSSSCVLVVCKPTLCMSPPTVLDYVLHIWACPGKERQR